MKILLLATAFLSAQTTTSSLLHELSDIGRKEVNGPITTASRNRTGEILNSLCPQDHNFCTADPAKLSTKDVWDVFAIKARLLKLEVPYCKSHHDDTSCGLAAIHVLETSAYAHELCRRGEKDACRL